jgi:hypothetical protein
MRSLQGYLPQVLPGALALIVAASSAPAPDALADESATTAMTGRSVVPHEEEPSEEEVTDARGNTVLAPTAKVPSFDVSAVARFAVMLGDTRELTQPIGYGFGIVMRVHPWRVGAAHFGFTFNAGHLRAPQIERLAPSDDPTGELTPRWQRVAMSDFGGGLSFRAPLASIVFASELGGGLVVGEFLRPVSASATEDERYEAVDPSMRAGISIGAPFRDNHGVVVGLALTKIFSGIDVEGDDGRSYTPFDLVTEVNIGYQGWF